MKICIIQSLTNKNITDKVALKAINYLKKNKAKYEIFNVSGSYEIPVIISILQKKFDGFIAIGCILKGKTDNYDIISRSISISILNLSVKIKKPIGYAIITCSNIKQAYTRLNYGLKAAESVYKIIKDF